jgi:HIRAN domain
LLFDAIGEKAPSKRIASNIHAAHRRRNGAFMFGWFWKKPAGSAQSGTIEREYNTSIVAIEHTPNAVELVRDLKVGDQVHLVREPNNPHDRNAIAVCNVAGQKIGYISARIAVDVTRALDEDSGKLTRATVTEKLAQGRDQKRFGADICFQLTRLRRDRAR